MYKLIRKDGQKYTFDYNGVEVTTSGKVVMSFLIEKFIIKTPFLLV